MTVLNRALLYAGAAIILASWAAYAKHVYDGYITASEQVKDTQERAMALSEAYKAHEQSIKDLAARRDALQSSLSAAKKNNHGSTEGCGVTEAERQFIKDAQRLRNEEHR